MPARLEHSRGICCSSVVGWHAAKQASRRRERQPIARQLLPGDGGGGDREPMLLRIIRPQINFGL